RRPAMRGVVLFVACVLMFTGCSTRSVGGFPVPDQRGVILDDDRGDGYERRSPGDVPPGHYPPPGECRIWFVNRPPGQQPPPARCDALVGRVPYGAFLLYNRRAWDTEFDWRREEARRP